MKKLSKSTTVIILSILSVLILAIGVGIALSMLSYKDPIDQQAEIQPLGNYDYSKRPFFASELPTIYKGDIYLKDSYLRLSRIPLDELTCDVRTVEKWALPKDYPVCTDSSHDHDSKEEPVGCFDYKVMTFLIDAYESAGGSPIVYRTRYGGFADSDKDIDSDKDSEIIRYDTGKMTGDKLVSVSDGITDVMTYDQWLFFMTCTADGVYSINVVSKKGGEITTLEVGKHGWSLMWANDDHVYYQDTAGNIYRATLDLQNAEFFFYAETISAINPDRIGTFIHRNYLYYDADYETVSYSLSVDGTQVINLAKHSIRRVPLGNVNGESELVAENVLDSYIFGVGNNVLYYQPCIMAEEIKEPEKQYYYNWTGGQLLGVNLDTLEQVDMINDIGLDLSAPDWCYAVGNTLIVNPLPTDGRYHHDYSSGMWGLHYFVYDTTTGALYPISINKFYA